MLVYGDVETLRDAAMLQREVLLALDGLPVAPGLERHAALVAAFLEAGDLVNGLLDREAGAEGQSLMEALTALALCVVASWTSRFATTGDLPHAQSLLARLVAGGEIRARPAEGYAFYALYPESYIEAALRSGLDRQSSVIGIRSIGTTLGAVVAAALEAAPPLTVRPTGHPFDRRIAHAGSASSATLLAGRPPAYVVVDEGPGLSGSSFGAVIDWLAQSGVPPAAIHLFPSHANGPGRMADTRRLEQWQAARHHLLDFDALLRGRLEGWIADRLGPLEAPLRDLSGGAWRGVTGLDAPVAPTWERRKYLAETVSGDWIIRFAGLGRIGEAKLALARALHAEGFGPETLGLCHGFLLQRWIEAPNLLQSRLDRPALLSGLARYLAFRARLALPDDAGASPARLVEMALRNTGEALGPAVAAALEPRLSGLVSSAAGPRVRIDARLHRWEWLVREDQLLKTDALDHAMAHDFIGAQPIAWDLAGALVEHDLEEGELLQAFEDAGGTAPTAAALAFYRLCYLAFQLGSWTLSQGSDGPMARRYAGLLAAAISSAPGPS